MKHIQCPVLLIHGQRDTLIPSQHSQILYDSLHWMAKKRLVLLPDDDHNSITPWVISFHLQSFLNDNFLPITEGISRVEISLVLLNPLEIFK